MGLLDTDFNILRIGNEVLVAINVYKSFTALRF
jgi:hypothetical protein